MGWRHANAGTISLTISFMCVPRRALLAFATCELEGLRATSG